MLLQFEMCGQDVNAASYMFKLQQAMNFSSLKLKVVTTVRGTLLLVLVLAGLLLTE